MPADTPDMTVVAHGGTNVDIVHKGESIRFVCERASEVPLPEDKLPPDPDELVSYLTGATGEQLDRELRESEGTETGRTLRVAVRGKTADLDRIQSRLDKVLSGPRAVELHVAVNQRDS